MSSPVKAPMSAIAARKTQRETQAREVAARAAAAGSADKARKTKKKKLRAGAQAMGTSGAGAGALKSGEKKASAARAAAAQDAHEGEGGGDRPEAGDGVSPPSASDSKTEQDHGRLSPRKSASTNGAKGIRTHASSSKRPTHSAQDEVVEARPLDPATPIFQPIWRGENTNVVLAQEGRAILLALPIGQAMAFRGIVQLRVRSGCVVVQGAVLTPSSAAAVLLAAARHACPAPLAVAPTEGSSSELSKDLVKLLPAASSDCAILELTEGPEDICSVEHFGRVFPLPGEEVPFGFKAGMDLLFEAGVPSLPHFRLIGGGGLSAWSKDPASGPPGMSRADVVELPPSWSSALSEAVGRFPQISHQDDQAAARVAASSPADLTCALVRGPRGVGKSLFTRTLLNALITCAKSGTTAVAFLDLDLGQTEFGPPSMITLNVFPAASDNPLLIGPAWTTLRTPVRAHFLGDVSPKNVPRAYVKAALDLIRFYQEHVANGYEPPRHSAAQGPALTDELEADVFQSRSRKRRRLGADGHANAEPSGSVKTLAQDFIPLVVNTQGWISGLGADLLNEIQTALKPSHVFNFSYPEEDEAGQDSAAASDDPTTSLVGAALRSDASVPASEPASTRVIRVSPSTAAVGPAAQPRLRLTAADQRTLTLLSYLHAEAMPSFSPAGEPQPPRWNFDRPLSAIPPMIVDACSGLQGGIHILPFGGAVPDKLKLHALNGSIVAVVERLDVGVQLGGESGSDVRQRWLSVFGQKMPSATSSRCLGLAIVRSIARDQQELELVGPMQAILAGAQSQGGAGVALALVKGVIDVPLQAALDFESIEYLRRPHLIGQQAGPGPSRPKDGGGAGGEDSSGDEDDEAETPVAVLSGRAIHGVAVERLPYLEWPSDETVTVVGGKKRRVRRNLQRRAH
ncbi:Polynucleotide 5'-hydroxyl-kinase grc3 [Tilletia horrida]|nr:Polynucleotide 5'-hydroxyl-kinase grc3 [Tilletia horrida]KAK0531537.1 Polynucleotide 5'-hydroxyl-kinase grc3 [Tilletia horrida]